MAKSNGNGTKHIADRETPLLKNQWYVAAWSEEVSRELLKRKLLNTDVVMYRTTDDKVVAVNDRCPHRSMPLSMGYLDGDRLVCVYHGIEFDSDGKCVRVPTQDKVPSNVCVPRYPTVERAPYIWIWMGDPKKADESLIPDHHWLSADGWGETHDYVHLKAGYLRMQENLLDLSHFTYLHAATGVGTPKYASAPYDVITHDDTVQIYRELKGDQPPDLYAWPMGIQGHTVDRISDAWFMTPGFNLTHAKLIDLDAKGNDRKEYHVEVIHALTPETNTSTHYFWAQARDYKPNDTRVDKFTHDALVKAFDEDVVAVEAIETIFDEFGDAPVPEVSFGADKAGLQMRRIIQRMADEEATAAD